MSTFDPASESLDQIDHAARRRPGRLLEIQQSVGGIHGAGLRKDEGGRMKDEKKGKQDILIRPSSLIPHPLSFILYPSSFILHPLSLHPFGVLAAQAQEG